MRIFITVLLLFLSVTTNFSQNTESSYWFIGREGRTSTSTRSVSILNFSGEELQIEKREDIKGISFDLNSTSIADENGNLLFYVDGCSVFDKEHELMKGAGTINEGPIKNDFCSVGISYPEGYASTLILSSPNTDSVYYIVHNKIEQFWPDEYSRTHYSMIDLRLNDGRGEMTERNQLILPDSTYLGEMSAVKHANGTDWWVIVPEDSNAVYNVLLLDSTGIRKSHEQKMGEKVGLFGTGSGQCRFSPDGSKFARWTQTRQLLMADFDRTTGLFENANEYHVQDSVSWGGVEFSPNGRFLYVSSIFHVDQFDLWADDFAASQVTVAIYDGYRDFVRTLLVRMQLTPDCRIFINAAGDHRYWHVIQNPNEKGLACNLEQHSLPLPTFTFNTLPYFPNYSLGPIGNEGYPCDSTKTKITFSSVDVPVFDEIEANVFPNPTSGNIQIDLPLNIGELNFQLFDISGKQVFTKTTS